ncbi:metal ABC transporter ATP-binding protein [Rhabdochlamydiaceae symbiont of Dictyostelium giganteum]|uniref:metal ABC transporter ATP-binding protein n=1 Tax=Rhabdochlamydiaceae symbiont of Dictyostelium giganteum TaxID=3342349 RepID=UPI00384CB3A1
MSAIDICDLSVNYYTTAVLWNISCSLPEGALIGIIGPNGAGKSTLLKAMLGLVEPAHGTVHFLGRPLKEVRKDIAYIPQKSSIDWDFPITAYELVLMGRYPLMPLLKWPSSQDHALVKESLRAVEMEEFAHRPISQLSGGQQQRLFVARALAQEALVFLLDEPFSGIDLSTEKALLNLFEKLKTQGKTVVIVHHDLATAKHVFDWVVMLNTCLIASGPTHTVLTPQNLTKTYGRGSHLLEEAVLLSQKQTSGFK